MSGIDEHWDDRIRGLCLRVYPTGRASWTFRYRPRAGGGYKRMSVGEYPALGLAEARQEAAKIRGAVSTGGDPQADRQAARQAITLGALIDRYMADEIEPKRKHGTKVLYRAYTARYVPETLKRKKAQHVARADLAKLHRDFGASHPASANRLLTFLSGAFTWAYRHGYVADERNPARHIEKFREAGRERYLTGEELARLGEALRLAETKGLPWPDAPRKSKHERLPENRRTVLSPYVVAAVRLLLFTGCRLREILHLKWSEVDFEHGLLRLADSKTGRKPVVLNAPALEILSKLPRLGRFVIAGNSNDKPRADLQRPWDLIRAAAGIEDVRIHDLRHTHASTGVNSGLSLHIVGGLLGHKHATTTQRYAHLASDPLRRASDRIGSTLAAHLEGSRENTVEEKIAS